MSDVIIVALVSGVVSLASAIISFIGSQSSAKRSSELIQYRIDQLEEKVSKHNNLVERMVIVEHEIENLRHSA